MAAVSSQPPTPSDVEMTDAPPLPSVELPSVSVPKGPYGRDPSTTLPRIINFLTDQDQFRLPGWKQRVLVIKKYLDEADKARRRGDLGYDASHIRAMLDDALILVNIHRRYYDWTTGPAPWSLDTISSQPYSTRLPTFSDHFLKAGRDRSRYKRKRIDYPLIRDRPDLGRPVTAPASPFAWMTRGGPKLMDLFIADEERFFEKSLDPQSSTDDTVNVFELDNDRYELCIEGGIEATLKRAPWRLPNNIPISPLPDATKTAGTSSSDQVPTDVQEFAIARGWQRAAIQQCLNIFSNHENRVINSPWRRVILPFREPLPLPKELVYHPRALPPEKVPSSLKDPYPFIHQYSKHNELMNVLASWQRRRHNLNHRASFDRSALPNNFDGPFIYRGLSIYDDHWLKLGSYLKRLHVLLQDAFGLAPRPLMLSILREIEAGMAFRPGPVMDPKHVRRDVMRRPGADIVNENGEVPTPGDTSSPRLLLIDEADAAWLRFLCEPSRTVPMCDPAQELQDNLAILFNNRLQAFLSDPNASGGPGITAIGDLFITHAGAWKQNQLRLRPTLERALAYINGSGSVDANETYQFSLEEADAYLRRLSSLNRCEYLPASNVKDSIIDRPFYELHPEHRITWRHTNLDALRKHNEEYRQTLLDHLQQVFGLGSSSSSVGQLAYVLDHVGDNQLPSLLAVASQTSDPTQATRDVLSQRIYGEFMRAAGSNPETERMRLRGEPNWSDLITWELLAGVRLRRGEYLQISERTAQFYRNLAYRMGRTIAHAEAIERRLQISAPSSGPGGQGRTTRWKAISAETFINDYTHWRQSVEHGTGELEFLPPTINSIIEKADPDQEFQNQLENKEELTDFDVIREGMINECVLNRNTVYPSRETVVEDSSGYYKNEKDWAPDRLYQGVKRPSLWKWATEGQRRYQAPFTRFAFFSMRRWPLACQNEAWREFIESRRDEVRRINPRHPLQQYGILAPRIPGRPAPAKRPGSKENNPQGSGPWDASTKNTTSDRGTKGPKGTKTPGSKGPGGTKHDGSTKLSNQTTTPELRGGYGTPPSSPFQTFRPLSSSSQHKRIRSFIDDPPGTMDEPIGPWPPVTPRLTTPPLPSGLPPMGPTPLGTETQEPTTPAATTTKQTAGPTGKTQNTTAPILRPFERSNTRFIPGPAVFPMAETLLQEVAISTELESLLYPQPKLNTFQQLRQFYNKLTQVPPRQIPLLPELGEHQIPRSNPRKRKIPAHQVMRPPKRQRTTITPGTANPAGFDFTGYKTGDAKGGKSVSWAPELTTTSPPGPGPTAQPNYSYFNRVRELEKQNEELKEMMRVAKENEARTPGAPPPVVPDTQGPPQPGKSPAPTQPHTLGVEQKLAGDFPQGFTVLGAFDSGRWGAFRAIEASMKAQWAGEMNQRGWLPSAYLLNAAFRDTRRTPWGEPIPNNPLVNQVNDVNSALQFYTQSDSGFPGAGRAVQLGVIFEDRRVALLPPNHTPTSATFRVWVYHDGNNKWQAVQSKYGIPTHGRW